MTPSIFDFDALNKEVEKLRKQDLEVTQEKYKWIEDYSKTTPSPPEQDQSYDYGCGYMECLIENGAIKLFEDIDEEEDPRVYFYDGPIVREL